MYFFHLFLLPHWGLMVNYYGFTKSRPTLNFIPPTMIIGALSYPLNKLLKVPECYQEYSGAEKYRNIFKSINIKLPAFSPYYDLSRVLFMHRGVSEFDAVAVGKLYKSSQESIEVIMIVDENSAKNLMGNRWRNLLRVACASITRVGAKESIVTPLEVKEGIPEPIADRNVKTKFSFPVYSTKSVKGAYIAGNIIDWREVSIGSYVGKKIVGYIMPTSREGVEVELADGYSAYKCNEEVIIPWQ